MKISKVNHVRTGTRIKENNGEGVLYANPSKQTNAVKDLSKHIQDVNQKAQGLYSPLNPVKSLINPKMPKEKKDEINGSYKAFKSVVIGIVKENETGIPDSASVIRTLYEKAKKIDLKVSDASYLSSKLIDKCLRKSLESKSEIAKEILKAIISTDKSAVNSLNAEEVKAFFELVHKDYYKKEQLKAIEKSIENKDVKVQVKTGQNGENHLVLSNADSAKKHYYFDFVKEFATKDKAEREEMIIRFRQLIILFYSGSESYKLSIGSDVGAWTFGSSLPEVTANVDDEIASLIAEYNENIARKNDIQKSIDLKSNQMKNYKFNSPEYKKLDDQVSKLKDEQGDCKHAISDAKRKIKALVENLICTKYRDAVKAEGLTDSDIFWIGYIQQVAQKQFSKKDAYNNYRISTKYLYEVTFNEWISFMASKYIDLGKAVYHFAMPDFSDIKSGKEVHAGKVQPAFEDGITSFDYERIKAKETLARDFSVYATYSSGIFSNAVTDSEYRLKDEKEDALFYKQEDWEQALLPNAKKKLLMYFGGQTKWEDSEIEKLSDLEMTKAFQDMINVIRNSNYHYAGSVLEPGEQSVNIAKMLFEKEFSQLGRIIREKYLSNNVPVYYNVEDINKMMTYLYQGESKREAQIPSFGNVLKKKEMPGFVSKYIPGNLLAKFDSEGMDKFRASLYFVLKEAYYYGFLNETNLKDRFIMAFKNSEKDAKNPEAIENFKARIADMDDSCSFGEICQILMTDYNQQNQGEYKVKSQIKQNQDEKDNKGHKYSHFKMLLYVTLQKAFIDYIFEKQDIYGYIKAPIFKSNFFDGDEPQKFVESWEANLFGDVKKTTETDSYYLAWYVLSHMLPAKQVNQLQGGIKSYIQFVTDINRREKSVLGTEKDNSLVNNIDYYQNILKVLEFVMCFVGKTSNVLTDYFADEDDYALHLYSYVGFAGKKEEKTNSTLSGFCSKSITKAGKVLTDRIGIYHDGTNPIVNNNVVKALMYGNENVLSEAVTRVSADLINGEITKYYEVKNKLEKVFEKGECSNIEEQKELREFQNLKNRIELQDISIFTEIINDYMSELVNMAYLRERDLMYYQLGYNYIRLEYGNVEDKYKELQGDNINIKSGALLYQIVALYTHELPIVYKDKDSYKYTNNGKIGRFVKSYCEEEFNDLDNTYLKGLELFEDIKLHDDLHMFRNEIDHLKYFIRADKSILQMYSRIYNGFFSYDLKLKKSVSYIFANILAKYFIIADTEMKSSVENGKRVAMLSVKGLESDVFTYKGKKRDKEGKERDSKYTLPVRSDEFLKEVKKLLGYKSM